VADGKDSKLIILGVIGQFGGRLRQLVPPERDLPPICQQDWGTLFNKKHFLILPFFNLFGEKLLNLPFFREGLPNFGRQNFGLQEDWDGIWYWSELG